MATAAPKRSPAAVSAAGDFGLLGPGEPVKFENVDGARIRAAVVAAGCADHRVASADRNRSAKAVTGLGIGGVQLGHLGPVQTVKLENVGGSRI